MTSLIDELSEWTGSAFEDLELPKEMGRVTLSDRPDLAQFQCNGALAAAKLAKKNPREIAAAVVDKLKAMPAFSEITIAGPGFINLKLSDTFLSARISAVAHDARFGVPLATEPKTIMIDFGGPNVAKPMHVGHLRSSIIGDSLQRLITFAGDKTVSDIHLGDWGLQMGQLISEIEIQMPDLPYFAPGAEGPFPKESPVSLEDLEALYPQAAAACKIDEDRKELARQATAKLQSGHPGYRALWKHFIDVSLSAIKREYQLLDVTFDLWKGESDVNDLIDPLVNDIEAKGFSEISDGALIVRVERDDDKSEIPPLILRKSDGSVMYGTTDVATIQDRMTTYDPDTVLYVVDQRQHLHFEQVFRTVNKIGLADSEKFEHIGFGTMNGTDGKPFKTREGDVMKLFDLIAMAREQASKRIEEAGLAVDQTDEQRAEVARMVGLAAIKFADLSNHRLSNYIFDLERFTAFEGKTGPYLLYAAVRIKSILRRAKDEGLDGEVETLSVTSDAERGLVLELLKLPDAISGAYEKRAPNILCDFVYAVAQAFSRFYSMHHILSEPDDALRRSRLALCALTLGEIELVLGLLGIEIPERM